MRVRYLRSDVVGHLPGARQFGRCSSCIGKSKQNNNRAVAGKQAVRQGSGTTGKTFDGINAYVLRKRPLLTFLENIPGVEEKDFWDDEGGGWQSDSDCIKHNKTT